MENKCVKIENGVELELFRDALQGMQRSALMGYTKEYTEDDSVHSGYLKYDEKGDTWYLGKTPEETVLNLAQGIVELIKINNEIPLDLRMNFLSVDGVVALDSFHNPLRIGDIVCHESQDEEETAEILSFEIDTESMEVKAQTTRGWSHIDFLYLADEDVD